MRRKPLLTYRRDQAGFKPGDPDPDRLIGGVIFADDPHVQHGWERRLRRMGFDYFIHYRDVHGAHSLFFGRRSDA